MDPRRAGPTPERVVDLIGPAPGSVDIAAGQLDHRPDSGQPAPRAGSERLRLDEVLRLSQEAPGRVDIADVEMCLGKLAHGEDATNEHRLCRCVGEVGELGDGT